MADEKKVREERMDEAEEQELKPERPEPVAPAGSAANLNKVVLGGAILAAAFVAATVFFLPPFRLGSSEKFILTKPMGGKWFLNPMLFIAAGVFAGLSWFVMKRLRPKLEYYKPGQGRWVRATGFITFAALALYGAVTLHRAPGLSSEWWSITLAEKTFLGQSFTLRPVFFPAAALFGSALLAWFAMTNKPAWADFQIETQSEMRKVSWPPTKEWTGSTMVVIVVMAFMGLFLFFADIGLTRLMEWLKIGI